MDAPSDRTEDSGVKGKNASLNRVGRGGSWYKLRGLRSVRRSGDGPNDRYVDTGFRVARRLMRLKSLPLGVQGVRQAKARVSSV